MTNKLWFKLNKSFGGHIYPKSFHVLTKAQIILSAKLANSIGKKFDALRAEAKQSRMTESEVATCIVALRKQVKRPEEITNSEEVADVWNSITGDRIESLLREHTLIENMAKQNQENNERLKQELQKKEEENKRQEEQLRALEEANLTRQHGEEKKSERNMKWRLRIFDIFTVVCVVTILTIVFVQSLWLGLFTVVSAIGGVIFLHKKIVLVRNWISKH